MELKPCPFCGCSAVIKHLDVFDDKWFYVKCQWCYAEINNLVPSEKEAIEAWNKRVNDDDLIPKAAAIDAVVFNSEDKFAVDVLNDVPAVDAVPVIRCRDCQHRGSNKICVKLWVGTKDNFFCGFGKRRDNE